MYKFKIWDKNKGWLKDGDFLINNFGVLNSDLSLNSDAKICQFSGQYDKFGKEIYEGDILYWTKEAMNKNSSFTHTKSCTAVAKKYPLIWALESRDGPPPQWDGCEIIGNLLETPELL